MAILMLLLLSLLLVTGFPIFIALSIPGFVAIRSFMPYVPNMVFANRMSGAVTTFTLLGIPFFIFAADIMGKGKIGPRLISFAKTLVGHISGGLAITTVLACMIFGAISGAGVTGIVSIGKVVYPNLIEEGYGKRFSLGLVITSSTLAMLIPPSLTILLYCVLASTSVRAVFMSGMTVGILFGIVLCIYSYFYAKRRKKNIQPGTVPSFSEFKQKLKEALWALGMPVIILGGIYSGIFTATEAAAVSAVYAMFVEVFIYKDLTFKDIIEVAYKSAKTSTMVMVLLAGGSLMSWAITVSQVAQNLVSSLEAMNLSVMMILIYINVVFLIAGMFIDPTSIMVIMIPLIYPIAVAFDINLIFLGVVITLNMAIGMLSPPFGLNLFVGKAVFGVPYKEIIIGIWPFLCLGLLVLIILLIFPDITTWLPNLLFSR